MAIRFEWDEAKNRANQRKHGMRFEDAIAVFRDPGLRLLFDRVVGEEERWQAIGLLSDMRVAVLVHTSTELDNDEIIRVISARKAEGREERSYGEQDG